jgi:transcription antitermination factor NusG
VRAKERDDAPPWRPKQPERPRDEEAPLDGAATTPAPPTVVLTTSDRPRRFGRRPPRATDVDPSIPIENGGRVVVLAGPFEGKHGIVRELDGRGGARVMLGLLAIRSAVTDLVASTEGRDRPVLSSSHRKRNRARS